MPEPTGLQRIVGGAESGIGPAMRILLIDDDVAYGRHLKKILERLPNYSFEVDQVFDLAAARGALSSNDPTDVILLDLDLPDSKGVDTAVITLQLAEDIPVIVLAQSGHEGPAWQTTQYGTQGVVSRDLASPEALTWALQHSVEQHLMRASLERHIRELELSKGRFLSLVVDNADAIVVVDRIGIVRFVNPSAERLLKCAACDLMGQMFGTPLEGLHTTEIDLCGRPGMVHTAEIRVMRTLWDGERAFIITMRDITERKKSEMALRLAKQTAEQASAMKSQFLANMSHELRTPLNAIIGYSEMMMMGIAGQIQPSRYQSYISDIHSGGKHLLALINELLDLSKAESGKLELMEENFDLVALAEQSVDLLHGQAERKGVHLRVSAETRSSWVFADERMLKQVLLNLIGNAVKFTPRNGSATVFVNHGGQGEARIVVRDNGIGIPKDQIPRAFAAFVQIENAYMRDENTGTGLGLALCKRYIEMHQGKIVLESAIAGGTVVTVTLPKQRCLASEKDGGDVVVLTPRLAAKKPRVDSV
ncbi:MAG: ATP-binding protein [Kiloniellaceae bacterium]